MSLTTNEGLRHIVSMRAGYNEVDGGALAYGLFVVHTDSGGDDGLEESEFIDLRIVSPYADRQKHYAVEVLDGYEAGRLPNDNARLAVSLIRFSGMSQCLQDKGL